MVSRKRKQEGKGVLTRFDLKIGQPYVITYIDQEAEATVMMLIYLSETHAGLPLVLEK